MKSYSLGIDIGTTSICALALLNDGEVQMTLNRPNSSAISSDKPYSRLQDPKIILDTVNALIAEIKKRLGEPSAVGITGQMHGIVYTDGNGNAVSPLYTWQDARAAEPMDGDESYISYINRMTDYKIAPGYGIATHFYNIKNGELPQNAKKLCTIHDLVAMKLSELASPIMHASDAASLGLYDLKNDRFDTSALDLLGIDTSILPDITADSAPIGTYGTAPVYPAIGDNQASFLGTVGSEDGTLLINIGTGSQVSMLGALRECENGIECRPFTDGKHLLVGSSLCGGRAYAILEKFFRAAANMCGAGIDSAYPFMDKVMSEYRGTGSLKVSTLFDGTRTDPNVRGSIGDISTDNFDPASLMDGFMRGIADELYSLYKAMGDCCEYKKLVGSGNALQANPYLCRVIEETFGAALTLSHSREEAALGAARLACIK